MSRFVVGACFQSGETGDRLAARREERGTEKGQSGDLSAAGLLSELWVGQLRPACH